MNNHIKGQRGQVGLVVLLMTVVLLTVGVSVASRSVTELQLSRQEQESTRALNLAESGIENLLAQDLSTLDSNGTVTVNDEVVNYNIDEMNVIEAMELEAGHTLEVTLAGAETTVDGLVISWTGSADACEAAAMEVILMPTLGNQIVRRFFGNCSNPTGDNFEAATYNSGIYEIVVPVSLATQASVRVKPLVAKTQVSVSGRNGSLGTQVYQVNTTMTMDDGTTRAVRVNKLASTAPSLFDYVLFSGNALVKNP